MDNFLAKKRKLVEDDGASNNPKLKFRQHNEDYLSFGFIIKNGISPCPIWVIGREILENEAVVFRHLQSRRTHLSGKSSEYFKRL